MFISTNKRGQESFEYDIVLLGIKFLRNVAGNYKFYIIMMVVMYFFVVVGAGCCGRVGWPSEEVGQSVFPLVYDRTKYTNTYRKGSQKHNYNCNIQGVSD
jgi:hypothetical protein